MAEAKLENRKIPDGEYTIDEDGNLTRELVKDSNKCALVDTAETYEEVLEYERFCELATKVFNIEISGNKPTSGIIKIENGGVSSTDTTMTVGDYDVKYNQEKNKYEATNEGGASSTTVVYRWSTDSTDKINLGDIINPDDTSKFTKDASTLGKRYYLKHVLDKDNKVTESYACAILKGKEYCLTNGEYGYAANPSDYTGNALLLKQIDMQKLKE